MERAIDLLRNEPPSTVMAALAEMETSVVTQFLTLVLKEEEKQASGPAKDTITNDQQCRR